MGLYLGNTEIGAISTSLGSGGSSANIDVTASVGQTIIVKEVDANGNPTKWEAADYQPRTHWATVVEVVPETVVPLDGGFGSFLPGFTIVAGNRYRLTIDGETMELMALSSEVGAVLQWGENLITNGEALGFEGDAMGLIVADDTLTSVTLSIEELNYTPLPQVYVTNAFPYYIDLTTTTADDGTETMTIKETYEELDSIFKSGRMMIVRRMIRDEDNGQEGMILMPLSSTLSVDGGRTSLYFAKIRSNALEDFQSVEVRMGADGTVVVVSTLE